MLLLIATAILSAQEMDAILGKAAEDLAAEGQPRVVSIANFTFSDTGVGSSFSRYLQERLAVVLTAHPAYRVFAREQLEEILSVIELSLNDLFDPSTAVQAGQLTGIQALIGGRYFDEGSRVRVFLVLTDVESGLVSATTEVLIPKAELPRSLSVLPQNYDDALAVIDELSRLQQADAAEFQVKLWTVRGDGAVYADGEELVIHLFASRDCYVKIYQIDVQKQMQLIFPNRFYPDNFIRKGRIYRIPDTRYPFRFVLGEPFGTEFVKLLASTVQFEEIEADFQDLGSSSREAITRGLSVEQREEQIVEAMISYTIVE